MVTREQFMNGLLSYIDREVIPALPTIGKWGVGTIVVVAKSKFDEIINDLSQNDIIKTLGIVTNDGLIDNDLLLDALHASAERYGNVQLSIPIVGVLTFSFNDIDKLKNYIINEGNYHDRSIM